jgi:hypothetical protein
MQLRAARWPELHDVVPESGRQARGRRIAAGMAPEWDKGSDRADEYSPADDEDAAYRAGFPGQDSQVRVLSSSGG